VDYINSKLKNEKKGKVVTDKNIEGIAGNGGIL